MTAQNYSIRLAWVLDFLALIALAGSGEVRLEVFGVVAAILLLSQLPIPRISIRLAAGTIFFIILGGLGAWFKFRYHPIVSAAHVAPLLHAVTWLVPNTGRIRGWRMGVGFVELVLASALTAEPYLFLVIFVFVILGSVAASCNYLDAELGERAPERTRQSLPKGFIGRSLALAFLIFLTSVIIFPILPRIKMDGGMSSDETRVGYTENVNLIENLRLNGAEGTGQPVLWLYPKGDVDLTTEIPMGLIRGRLLDVFDGTSWSSSPRVQSDSGRDVVGLQKKDQLLTVEALRDALPTDVLPVPYGTTEVTTGDGGSFLRTRRGEWIDPTSARDRVRFSFSFLPFRLSPEDRRKVDPPTAINTYVPEALKNERMHRLVRSIFEGVTQESDRVDRLQGFLLHGRFTPSYSNESSIFSADHSAVAQKMHPLERFLFITREGHCEWFASASAILLRMAGVPTRLVAGFRITTGQVGGVLTLTSNDAHAWLEYWNPAKGWIPFDPTPRMLRPPSFINYLRDGYDWISGYWYRYILGYRDGSKKEGESTLQSPDPSPQGADADLKSWQRHFLEFISKNRHSLIFSALAFLFLAGSAYFVIRWKYPWLFSIRYRVREGSGWVRQERIRMERLLSSRGKRKGGLGDSPDSEELKAALASWQNSYHRARFGRPDEDLVEAKNELDGCYRRVKRVL